MCTPEEPVLLRSVIQPDADILMWVAEDVLKDPSIWETHLSQVQAKFDFVHRLRAVVQGSRFLIPLPSLFGGIFSLVKGEVETFLYSLGTSFLLLIVRTGLVALFRRYIRRKINQFMSG